MAATNFALPALLRLEGRAAAQAAAVLCAILIGTGTGTLIALVVPLAEHTLARPSHQRNSSSRRSRLPATNPATATTEVLLRDKDGTEEGEEEKAVVVAEGSVSLEEESGGVGGVGGVGGGGGGGGGGSGGDGPAGGASAQQEYEEEDEAGQWLPHSALPQASGLVYSMLAVGIVLGPTAAGALFDASASYDAAFYLCGFFGLAATAAAAVLAARTSRVR